MPIDFSYLEGAAPQEERTPVMSDTANVTIRVDVDSLLLCDGDYIDQPFKTGALTKIQLPIGQHLLEFLYTKDPDIKIEKEVDFPESGKSYLVLIKGLKELVDAAEAEAKQKAEEEARKKAEAEAKRKAEEEEMRKAEEEAKRKAEEEAKRKAEEEAKRKAEEEAKRKAEEEAKREAQRLVEKKLNKLYDLVLVQGDTGYFQQMAFKKILGIGLKEAHELIHSAPCIIKKSISKSEAEAIKKQLEKEASAEVIIK